jgi:response regulator NasT
MPFAAGTLPRLRIVVVDDDPTVRRLVKRVVTEQLGHDLIGEAETGPDMVETVLATRPDVVIFDIHLPTLDGLDALRRIYQDHVVAAVAMTADRDAELVTRALDEHVMAYLVKPFEPAQLLAALHLAWARSQEWQALTAENASLKQVLQERKLIERAKGILMKRQHWSEPEAFRRLQRTAMNQRRSMADLAQAVLNDEALDLDPA